MDPTAQSQAKTQSTVSTITDQLAQQVQQLQDTTQKTEQATVEDLRLQHQQQAQNAQLPPNLTRLQSLLSQQPVSPTEETTQTPPIKINKDKERINQFAGFPTPEQVPIREVAVDYEPTQELQEWVKPTPNPQTITLPKPVTDDFGSILVQSTTIPKPQIELPLTEEAMEKALHLKIIDSIRWLAEWCRRVVMMEPERTQYSKPNQ